MSESHSISIINRSNSGNEQTKAKKRFSIYVPHAIGASKTDQLSEGKEFEKTKQIN